MKRYNYKGFVIDVFNDAGYNPGSNDNVNIYSKEYGNEECRYRPVSKHGIKIYRDNKEIESCILMACAGPTGVYQNSSLIDQDKLLVCCCNIIFCLALPSLELCWETIADWATCFEIFKLQDDYIVHGELEISRLSGSGGIIWQFGGADIFVTPDGADDFGIGDNYIWAIDWNGQKYKLGFDGKGL